MALVLADMLLLLKIHAKYFHKSCWTTFIKQMAINKTRFIIYIYGHSVKGNCVWQLGLLIYFNSFFITSQLLYSSLGLYMNHVFVHPPSYTTRWVVSQKNVNKSKKYFFCFWRNWVSTGKRDKAFLSRSWKVSLQSYLYSKSN